MKLNRENLNRAAAAVTLAFAPLFAMAATTTDTTAISNAGSEIAAVGAAVFGVYVAIKLTKWIRRAL